MGRFVSRTAAARLERCSHAVRVRWRWAYGLSGLAIEFHHRGQSSSTDLLANMSFGDLAAVASSGSSTNAGGSLELEGEHDLVERTGRVRDSWCQGRAEVLKITGYSVGIQVRLNSEQGFSRNQPFC